MADDLQAYKVAANEQSSSSKFNNLVQAVQDALNSIDNSNVSGAAAILVSKLAAGSNGDVLSTVAGVPTWGAPASGATYQTTLPGSPTNGQVTYLVDSTTAPTYCWALRYNSAKSSNKWDFIGGSALYAEVATLETTSSASYVALATAGPSVVLPVAGDYMVAIGSLVDQASTAVPRMSYDIGGTGAVDADAIEAQVDGTNQYQGVRERKKLALTAVTLTAKYKTAAGTAGFADRWIRVTPIAVGG